MLSNAKLGYMGDPSTLVTAMASRSALKFPGWLLAAGGGEIESDITLGSAQTQIPIQCTVGTGCLVITPAALLIADAAFCFLVCLHNSIIYFEEDCKWRVTAAFASLISTNLHQFYF